MSGRRYEIRSEKRNGKTNYAAFVGRQRIVGWSQSLAYVEAQVEKVLALKKGKDRPCLRCGTVFRSHGPGNRLCRSCIDVARGYNADAYSVGRLV